MKNSEISHKSQNSLTAAEMPAHDQGRPDSQVNWCQKDAQPWVIQKKGEPLFYSLGRSSSGSIMVWTWTRLVDEAMQFAREIDARNYAAMHVSRWSVEISQCEFKQVAA